MNRFSRFGERHRRSVRSSRAVSLEYDILERRGCWSAEASSSLFIQATGEQMGNVTALTSEEKKPSSLANSVYGRLRVDILSAAILPGTKLTLDLVCERYQIGSSPVREALTRLAAERLVEKLDQRGFFVSRVSRSELVELTNTRCWVEEVALRNSIRDGDDEWEERIVLAMYKLEKTPRSLSTESFKTNSDWEARHIELHEALIAASGSRWLLDFCAQLRDLAYRYRQIAAAERAGVPRREHQAIVAATLQRKSNEAVELLTMHYRHTMEITLAHYADDIVSE